MQKVCTWCKQPKNEEDFYFVDKTRIKRMAACKICMNRQSSEYSKRTYDPVKAKVRHLKMIARGTVWPAQKRNMEKYPEKWEARRKLRYAVKKGEVLKFPCEVCGEVKVEGHHPDYTKPLEVKWLCVKHHRALHKQYINNNYQIT